MLDRLKRWIAGEPSPPNVDDWDHDAGLSPSYESYCAEASCFESYLAHANFAQVIWDRLTWRIQNRLHALKARLRGDDIPF